MKRFLSGVGVAVLLLIATNVSAAGLSSMSLSPQSQRAIVGESFSVDIVASPNGEEIDTVRAFVDFDPQTVRAISGELGDSFGRSAPGNYIDNRTGRVSLGGFNLQGPVTLSGVFGTIIFEAIKEGDTEIRLGQDSRMIANGEEKINTSVLRGASVVVDPPVVLEEGVALLSVSSSTHDNTEAWYTEKTVELSWSAQNGGEIGVYYATLDKKPNTNPDRQLAVTQTNDRFDIQDDGIWFYHIKAQQTDGRFTNIVHRKIQVDATPPNPITPVLSRIQIQEGDAVQLSYGTTDETSGVIGYEVSVNQGPFVPQVSPVNLDNLKSGNYFIAVKAIDRAGNSTAGSNTMRVYPKDTPLPDIGNEGAFSEDLELPTPQQEPLIDEKSSNSKLLITFALGTLLLAGIIIAISVKRRK